MKPGDTVQTYGDPINLKVPLGPAKLLKFVEERRSLELWQVEYLDQPGKHYNILLNKNTMIRTNPPDGKNSV